MFKKKKPEMGKEKGKKEFLTIGKEGGFRKPKFIKTAYGWKPVDDEAWNLVREIELDELKQLKEQERKRNKLKKVI
jgi:hypothetical protein